MTDLLEIVREFLKSNAVAGGDIVVAVSGGPDSIALLTALVLLRDELSISTIIIVHLNHGLRGTESDEDALFVQNLCEQLSKQHGPHLRLEIARVDVPEVAQKAKQSIETTARNVRYEWLTTAAKKSNAAWVATGHTADDQAETILHRLIRGTGVKGLRGIPARRSLAPGIVVIRPLLQVSRSEVLKFLEQTGQEYRIDSSNEDTNFTRNRIRRKLLPLLTERFNPQIVSVLCRLSGQADKLFQMEEELAVDCLRETELPRAGNMLIFDLHKLAAKPAHQVSSMFRYVWQRENWPMQEMGFEEWRRITHAALGEPTAVDLPGRLRVRRRGNVMQVGRIEH